MKYLLRADKIIKARLNMGMSQAALAQRTGMSQLAIFKIEAGKTLNPRPATLKNLCETLNLSISDVCEF